jgi:histidyl-tRNA synthetase
MASTNPARGMRDFLPADVRKREYVIGIIKQVYESYGFEPLETPAVENIDTLMGKYGDEGNQLIFKILKRGEKLDESLETRDTSESDSGLSSPVSRLTDLALRYDLTVPFARVVANNRDKLPKFFKRYQIQPVWRADRPARGRFREFYQCDVDCIGSKSMVAEAEIISAACEILTRLGFTDFTVRINHRKLLSELVAEAGIDDEANALVALDKLDKIGADGVRKELIERGIRDKSADKFLASVVGNSTNEELDTVIRLCADRPVKIDPTLARGLSYYTGTIMEINVPDLAGSLGGGGRYDGLIGMFCKEQIPACGFSLGLERILVVMDERGMFPPEIADSRAADVMVTIWSEQTVTDSLKLANELRAQGLRVTLYLQADKLAKQIKHADSIGVPFVCVLGESEIASGKVTLKNMKTGEQKSLAFAEIVSNIK